MKKRKKEKQDMLPKDIVISVKDEQQKPEAKEEPVKREHKAVKAFNMYKFIFKIFAFAILLTFGILIWVFKDSAIGAIYLITGVAVAFAALIRVIPLLRTLKSGKARVISLCEIVLHIVIGIYLVGAAFSHWSEISKDLDLSELQGFAKFNLQAYQYILVILFYTRVLCYFWITILYKEETDRVKFWLHIILMTLAVILAALPLDPEKVVYTLIVLAFACALVIGGEAGTGYYRYRKSISTARKKNKGEDKKKDKGIEVPAKDDSVDISDIDPNIIPLNDDIPQDSNIVS